MAASKQISVSWSNLIIGSGLAAALAALGSFAVEYARGAHDTCAIAASVLQDDTLSPYLDDQSRKRIAIVAASRFERCMKD